MKKLRIFVTNFTPQKDAYNYFLKFKNPLIDVENQTFYSKHSNTNEKLSFETSIVSFDQELVNSITYTIKVSALKAIKLKPDENDNLTGVEREKDGISSMVSSLIMKYSYKTDYFDIFDFLTDIFIKLLQNHIFYNGNKRTSIIALRLILWDFGYYFKWGRNSQYGYAQMYEKDVVDFVNRLSRSEENTKIQNKLNTIKDIKEWIMKNTWIALHFRT